VRVLAGALKGKVLHYPKTGIKPTTELTRAAIFNIISDLIIKARVADFFCGAGALGIEALSRGAKLVYFFEKSNRVLKFLKQNLQDLEEQTMVIKGDAFKKISALSDLKFDIILADPPYLKGFVRQFIERIAKNLSRDGLIVVQHHKKEEINVPKEFYLIQQKRYGDTVLSIIRRKNENCRLSG
jgi:16S rRNA (guanine966-N2)-methyltransferase